MFAQKLPVIKKKKMMNSKKFVKLAKDVRKIFEAEEKKLVEKGQDGINSPTRFLLSH
jgi:hypothetical protein